MSKKTPKLKKPSAKWLRRLIVALAVVCALAVGGYFAYGALTDQSRLDVTFYELADDKIVSPVRIAFLSDLHLKEFGKGNADLIDKVAALAPDLILIGGDMNVSGNPDYQKVLMLVEGLLPVAPVYYALGNHEFNDYLFEDSKLTSDVKALGATVLSNNYVTVDVNGFLMDIGGLNEMTNHFDEYSQKFYQSFLQSENYRVLLAHDAGYYDDGGALIGDDIDLALCGHRHGGQVVVPFLGGLYHPGSGFLPGMTEGAHALSGMWVVVSRGLGNAGRIPRVNNPPELVIVDLY